MYISALLPPTQPLGRDHGSKLQQPLGCDVGGGGRWDAMRTTVQGSVMPHQAVKGSTPFGSSQKSATAEPQQRDSGTNLREHEQSQKPCGPVLSNRKITLECAASQIYKQLYTAPFQEKNLAILSIGHKIQSMKFFKTNQNVQFIHSSILATTCPKFVKIAGCPRDALI